jgi:adenine-specific DNA-methyltransferase
VIENVDCLEFLSKQEDNSVDMVLTDPPYFIGFDGGKGWDKQWESEAEYLEWCRLWTNECVRVLKPGRMLVVWGTMKTDAFLRYKLQTAENNPSLVSQNEIIWSYNWGGRSKANFARKHEYAWCWSKGKKFLFNDAEIRVERKVKKNLRTGKDYAQGTIPTCVWEKNNHTTSKDFCGWHPTTKNLYILERLIRAYTNAGDTVLDIFMGSGSTALAASRAGRLSIGCEKDEDYYKQMQVRLSSFDL